MDVLRLKEFREKANLSQRDIARLLNMTQQGYWAWEVGKNSPNPEQILQLCDIFRCTPNELFGVRGQYQTSMYLLDKEE